MLTTTVLTLVVVLIFLMSILFTILGERRTLAEIQGREGPSVTGFGGFVQAIVDGMKTFFKAVLVSKRSFKVLFFMLPAGLLLVNIIKFAVLPLSKVGGFVDFEYDLAFLNLLGSFEVFIFVFASWVALSSKFPTIAALRGIAQQCAVEALTGFCFIIVALYAGSLSIRTVVESQEYVWYFFVVTPYAYVYYLAILSELHRTPSDVTEAESELTAGYQVEHGGILFSLFYLSEYGGIVVSAIVFSLLFLGGWFLPLGLGAHSLVLFLKVVSFLWWVVLTRATLPRVRIKALASITWSHLLPFSSSALPNYLWLGIVLAAFRVCEYCVYGIEAFRQHVSRIYYIGRNFWYFRPTARDTRLDTSLGSFIFMRQLLDWGQLGKVRVLDNTGIPYMTYPENARWATATALAGGLAVEGARREQPFDAELSDELLEATGMRDERLHSKLWFEHSYGIQRAKRDSMYWGEMLLGDFMKFAEWTRAVPSRDAMQRHDVGDYVLMRDITHGRTDIVSETSPTPKTISDAIKDETTLVGTISNKSELMDEQIFRRYNSEADIVDFMAYGDTLRSIAQKHGSGPQVTSVDLTSPTMDPDVRAAFQKVTAELKAKELKGPYRTCTPDDFRYGWAGDWDQLRSTPSGYNEFLQFRGATADDLNLSEWERVDRWLSDTDSTILDTYDNGIEPADIPFVDRLIRAKLYGIATMDPSMRHMGHTFWNMVNENLDAVKPLFGGLEQGRIANIMTQEQYQAMPDLYKKYYGMAAFCDERDFDYGKRFFNDVNKRTIVPPRGDFSSGSYVPLDAFGYIFTDTQKYFPHPVIINHGSPDMKVGNIPSRYVRPGVDPFEAGKTRTGRGQ